MNFSNFISFKNVRTSKWVSMFLELLCPHVKVLKKNVKNGKQICN